VDDEVEVLTVQFYGKEGYADNDPAANGNFRDSFLDHFSTTYEGLTVEKPALCKLPVNGMPTASFARQMGTGPNDPYAVEGNQHWFSTVLYYDDYGRVIQTVSHNHGNPGAGAFPGDQTGEGTQHSVGSKEVTTTQYDWRGRVLKTVQAHNPDQLEPTNGDPDDFLVTERYVYNDMGSYTGDGSLLMEAYHQVTLPGKATAEPEVRLAKNAYNELGSSSKRHGTTMNYRRSTMPTISVAG
jgi:hypothetical protein